MATSTEIRAALADSIETGLSCRYGESDIDVWSRVEKSYDDLDCCMRGGFIVCSAFEYNKKKPTKQKPTAKDLPRRNRRRF